MLGVFEDNFPSCHDSNGINKQFSRQSPLTVAVEGNIGCGKTTFLNYFSKYDFVECFCEPVSKWKNVNGHNTLDLMYKDASRWSFAFQSYAQLTMLDIHHSPGSKGSKIKMIERSIHSGRHCFIENLKDGSRMSPIDYSVLCKWYDYLCSNYNVQVDLTIYLRTDPAVCLERIKSRNRLEESNIPPEYLRTLHDLHEKWLMGGDKENQPNILVVDANQSLEKLEKQYERCKQVIWKNIGQAAAGDVN